METLTAKVGNLEGKWEIDQVHSNLNFTVDHLVISQVTGSFEQYEGRIKVPGQDWSKAEITFSIRTASINTRNETRDQHLKSDDFFNSEEFPEIKFQSSSIEVISDSELNIHGEMTIRDITHPMIFRARIGGIAVDPYGNTKLGLKVQGRLNRFDYKLKWNQMTEAGGMVVGKEVEINAQLQFAKQ